MGMCIVLILVCAFSFLVYHKYDLKQKALALANATETAVDSTAAADSNATKPEDRYSEFDAASRQPTSLAASKLDQNAAPGFAGNAFVPDVVEKQAATAEMLVADFVPQDSQFELSEPEESFEAQSARDVLAAGEEASQTFDAFTAGDLDADAPGRSQDNRLFAESEFGVEARPAASEPMKSVPASELAVFEPTSLQPAIDEPAFDEPAFAAFDTPEQDQPQAMVKTSPAVTPLPPASDVVDAETFDAFDSITPQPLPPVETKPSAQVAVADAKREPNVFSDFAPLATDEPKSPTLFGDVAVSSSFEPEPPPAAVLADITPQPAPQPFTKFGAEPEVATVIEDSTPLRHSAPMPDFAYSEAKPQSKPQSKPAEKLLASDQITELIRRDKLVAMSSSAPDVDVFGPEPKVTADAPPLTTNRSPQVTRQFQADSPGISGFAETEVPLPPESKRVPPPALKPIVETGVPPKIRSGLSIPVTQLGDGIAQFVTPPQQTVQQVSGISEECDICEVQPNDNYWRISQRVYGTARYFSSLALYNRQRIPDPKKLRPGMKVMIPEPKLLEQKYPEFFKDKNAAPKQPEGYFLSNDGSPAYRIGAQETLSEISQKHLGRASRWIQIYRMNQHILKDPNKLKPGTVIALPDDATSVHLAP